MLTNIGFLISFLSGLVVLVVVSQIVRKRSYLNGKKSVDEKGKRIYAIALAIGLFAYIIWVIVFALNKFTVYRLIFWLFCWLSAGLIGWLSQNFGWETTSTE